MTITVHTDRAVVADACARIGAPAGAACVVEWTDEDERPDALRAALRRGATVEIRGRTAAAYRRMRMVRNYR